MEAWDGATVRFRYPDPGKTLAAVRLLSSVRHADLAYAGDGWHLDLDAPPAQRIEYRFELTRPDGTRETSTDPGNPMHAEGGFGPSSVVHRPDYAEPDWLHRSGLHGIWRTVHLPVRGLQATVDLRIWSPDGPDAARTKGRVLLAHDGTDYERFAALARYSAAMIRAGSVPPYHLVLVNAGERAEWYSASPAYSLALAGEIIPRIRAELGGPAVVGAGASLGALAMLHAQRRHPAGFAGLFLQSGSYFQPRHDSQESGFERWGRIVRFTGQVLRGGRGPGVPAALTCGAAEENLANNRDMAEALTGQGYQAAFAENPDAHTWTGWRDALDPHLTALLCRVWPD
ncbi:enterochelin esterase family protein [Actinoplanes lutulentus]|uniref:Enterochelin esterase family protein n=1 Tax=Actinoplanes lutulentus TaxID=1287878 RepID=A0A327Z4C2_9ACTN|nr:alpha/beta hydrolase-fold protein [Actinoplanes lutulentus]MBB2949197.1 enterochelin esterase family protein [Actinoplanes lutulentus]RAK27373.1 enterochelin esterase family protein [Actinoplanes lutulentus]